MTHAQLVRENRELRAKLAAANQKIADSAQPANEGHKGHGKARELAVSGEKKVDRGATFG